MKKTFLLSLFTFFAVALYAQVNYRLVNTPYHFNGDKSDALIYQVEVEVSLNPGDSIDTAFSLALDFQNAQLSNGKKIAESEADSLIVWADELNNLRTKTLSFQVNVKPIDTVLEFHSMAYIKRLDNDSTVLDIPYAVNFKEEQFDFGSDQHLVGHLRLCRDQVVLYRRVKVFKREALKESLQEWEENSGNVKMSFKERKFRKRYKINGADNKSSIVFNSVDCLNKESCVHINNVRIEVAEGRIGVIAVHTNKGLFMNKGPLSLTNFEKRKFYRLDYAGTDFSLRGTCIVIGDFLTYEPTTSRKYFPSKNTYEFKAKNDSRQVISKGDPLSFFEARVYTDGKGLSGEENGLVLTELHARFIANSNAIGSSNLTMAQFLHLNLNWSKFDSQFDTLSIPNFNTVSRESLLPLIQRSNTMVNAELDLFRGSRVHDLCLSVGTRVYHTKVADTNGTSQRVFTPMFSAGLSGNLYSSRMIELSLGFPVYGIFRHDQPFGNISSKWELMIVPEIEIRITYPKDKNGEESRMSLFGRLRYFDMPFVRGDNFWQIQTGVQIPLTNVFKEAD